MPGPGTKAKNLMSSVLNKGKSIKHAAIILSTTILLWTTLNSCSPDITCAGTSHTINNKPHGQKRSGKHRKPTSIYKNSLR